VTRSQWQACKKKSAQIRLNFLKDRAELMAQKMRTAEEKALRAIMQAESSKQTYKKIQDTFGTKLT
jgi:hypothetical protein